MSVIGKMVLSIVGDWSQLRKDLNNMQKELKRTLGRDALEASKALTGAMAGLTAGVGALGLVGIKLAADLEQTKISFEVLTGSAEKAKQIVEEFQQMGAQTPYESKDLLDAAQTMMLYGVEVEKVSGYVRMLGDVAAGSPEKLKLLSLAFSQVQANGRLMGQDLLQMVNAGFNPLQIISEKTGKSMSTLKAEMEKGGISARMVADAFQTATAEGGRFNGMMDKQSQTINGLLSTVKDTVTFVLQDIGQSLIDAFDLKNKLKGAIQWLDDFAKAIREGGIKQALGEMIPPELKTAILAVAGAIVGAMIPALKTMAIDAALAIVPLLPYIATFAALGLAIGYVVEAQKRERYETEQSLKAHQKQLSTGNELVNQYQELASKANKTNEEKARMIELSNKIAEVLPSAVTGYDKEGNAIIDLNLALVNMITLKREELALRAKELDFEIRDLEAKNKRIAQDKNIITLSKQKTEENGRYKVTGDALRQSEEDQSKAIEKKNAEMRRNQIEIDNLKAKQQDLLNQSKNVTAETIRNDLGLNESKNKTIKKEKEVTQVTQAELDKRAELEKEWSGKLLQELGTRRDILAAEEADAISQAEKIGADTTAIRSYYKEQRLKLDYDETKAREQNATDARKIIEEEAQREYEAKMQAAQSFENILGRMSEISNMYYQNRITVLDNHYQKEKERIEKSILPEEEKQKQLALLDEETRKKKREAARKQAKEDKEFAIFETVINTSMAVIKTLASVMWPLNMILAAAVAAMGLAEINAIKSRPLPELAEGGFAVGPTQAIIGEGDQNELILPLQTGIDRLTEGIVNKLSQLQAPQLQPVFAGGGNTYNTNSNRNSQVIINFGNYLGNDADTKRFARTIKKVLDGEDDRVNG